MCWGGHTGAEEKAQWVKYLLCQREDYSSNPQCSPAVFVTPALGGSSGFTGQPVQLKWSSSVRGRLKNKVRAGEMAQWLQAVAIKPEYLSLIPGPMCQKEMGDSHKLSSDFYKCEFVCTYTQTQTNKCNKK